MFKIVRHNGNGFTLKLRRKEEVKKVPEHFCERCQKQFKGKQGLFMHNLKVHPIKK